MMSKNVKLVIVKLALIMKERFEKLLLNSLYFITYLLLNRLQVSNYVEIT